MKRVLVTGASGFIGQVLCGELARSGYRVRAALRPGRPPPHGCDELATVEDIADYTGWAIALEDVEVVVHLAARAHVPTIAGPAENAALRINATGTQQLATAAARANVRRLVYLSSVKVNGEQTFGRSFTGGDEPQPADFYARSKWLGERLARDAAGNSGLELVVVRAPLVYGPQVRANFRQLMRWVDRERPLPFGAIANSRSLVSVWNLADLLVRVIEHPAAAGQVLMVSDNHDLSTPELIRRLAQALGRRPRLLRIPARLVVAAGRVLGCSEQIGRLCGSLVVDISATCQALNWTPPLTVDEGLGRTARWYRTAA